MLNRAILISSSKGKTLLTELFARLKVTVGQSSSGIGVFPQSGAGAVEVLEGPIQFTNSNAPYYCMYIVDLQGGDLSMMGLIQTDITAFQILNETTQQISNVAVANSSGENSYVFYIMPKVFNGISVGESVVLSIYK